MPADPERAPRVHVLWHVVSGVAHEIEIYKDDGTPILIPPETAQFEFYPDWPPGWID
jgi:hypothetical protein